MILSSSPAVAPLPAVAPPPAVAPLDHFLRPFVLRRRESLQFRLAPVKQTWIFIRWKLWAVFSTQDTFPVVLSTGGFSFMLLRISLALTAAFSESTSPPLLLSWGTSVPNNCVHYLSIQQHLASQEMCRLQSDGWSNSTCTATLQLLREPPPHLWNLRNEALCFS